MLAFAHEKLITTVAALASLILFCTCANGQSSAPLASRAVSPSHDPAAITVAIKAIQAAGGEPLIHTIADFSANGTIDYWWADQDVIGQVDIKARGTDQARMDVRIGGTSRSTVLNHGRGTVDNGVGAHEMPPQNVRKMGLLIFPILRLLNLITNPHTIVRYGGDEAINGLQAIRLDLTGSIPAALQGDERALVSHIEQVFIDPNSFMVVAVRHPYVIDARHGKTIERELVFSEFRNINGAWFPFQISESQGGQHTSTIRLAAIVLNAGISSTEFDK